MKLLLDFWLFSRISEQKGIELIAQFEGIFTHLRAERNVLVSQFLAICTNWRPER